MFKYFLPIYNKYISPTETSLTAVLNKQQLGKDKRFTNRVIHEKDVVYHSLIQVYTPSDIKLIFCFTTPVSLHFESGLQKTYRSC